MTKPARRLINTWYATLTNIHIGFSAMPHRHDVSPYAGIHIDVFVILARVKMHVQFNNRKVTKVTIIPAPHNYLTPLSLAISSSLTPCLTPFK
jgi:hypothetical protein